MNAEFFILAFTAALNVKLLAVDLLLIENSRPRAMFACILAGAMGVAIGFGLVDVLAIHADAIKAQKKPSAGLDLALGLILLILGTLLFTGILPVHRSAKKPAGEQQPKKAKTDKESRITRILREPRLGFAFGIGILCGLPGGVYLTALHHLVAGNYSNAIRVIAVIVFVIIEFLLIIIPWLLLEVAPERTPWRSGGRRSGSLAMSCS
jgi:Sap, sulfolipid-1-addressing protein